MIFKNGFNNIKYHGQTTADKKRQTQICFLLVGNQNGEKIILGY
jgi:hypothetical protein